MKDVHDVHHRNLLRKRNDAGSWGDTVIDAWAAAGLLQHPNPDRATASALLNSLGAPPNAKALDSGRDLTTASLIGVALGLCGREEADRVRDAVEHALIEAKRRETAGSRRFSVFNSPECVFASAACIGQGSGPAFDLIRDCVASSLGSASESRATRIMLFSAAALELGEAALATNALRRFVSTLDPFALERSDFLFTFWFWERYPAQIEAVVGASATEIRERLRERLSQWWEFEGSSLSAGEDSGFSPVEAVILDEALARASGTEPFSPMQLFDAAMFHPIVVNTSRSLFQSGHFAQAIFEAFKAVNNEVKRVSGLATKDGKDLMANVFNEQNPQIRLNPLATQSDRDEQEGFKFIFMGSMLGIRNPKAHELILQTDVHKTLEYLSLASLLLRRIDERVT